MRSKNRSLIHDLIEGGAMTTTARGVSVSWRCDPERVRLCVCGSVRGLTAEEARATAAALVEAAGGMEEEQMRRERADARDRELDRGIAWLRGKL